MIFFKFKDVLEGNVLDYVTIKGTVNHVAQLSNYVFFIL